MAATPLRNVRVPDDVWQAAMRRAQRSGVPLSVTIVEWLTAYGSAPDPDVALCRVCGDPLVGRCVDGQPHRP